MDPYWNSLLNPKLNPNLQNRQHLHLTWDPKIEQEFPAIRRIRHGYRVAGEMEATQADRRAWLSINPLFPYDEVKHKGDYHLLVVEVEKRHLEVDQDDWDTEGITRVSEFLVGEAALLERVRAFMDPRKVGGLNSCDYPL